MNKLLLSSILLIGFGQTNSFPIGPSDCDICQVFVKGGKNFLSYNHTIVELQNHLDLTCDFFGPYRDTCKFFVGELTPKTIVLIDNNDTAYDVCSQVGACVDYDYLNNIFSDIIDNVEGYDSTIDSYASVHYPSDNNVIYEKANDTKPSVDSRPIIFEFIDFGDFGDI
jgi:hypothetical protein